MIDVDWKQDPVAQAVQGLNHELTNAQVERIQYESFLKAVESGNADSLPQIRDNLMIQSLIEKSAELKAELAQALVTYGKNNPNAKRLQQQVDVLDAELTKQRQSVYTSIRISYQAAKKREAMLDQQLKGATNDVGLTARFLELKKKAQANSDLYNTLYTQVQQANITAASRSSNISVVDRARVLDMPSHPKKMLNLAVGLMAAMFGGLLIAFVKEGLDPTIRSSQEFKHWNGIPAVALMPALVSNGNGKPKSFRDYLGHRKRASLEGHNGLEKFLLDRPLSPEAEAIRNLHASIVLANHGTRRMFLIASAMPGEGKTTLATNLALSLARHSKTCLVDADMRRPSVAKAFGLECQHGLADVLLATVPLADALVTVTNVPNLTVLPATPLSPDVVQLVDTLPKRDMLQELRAQFEYIVIDSSPLVPFADSRSIAPLVDGIILVGRYGVTNRSSVARCVELLSEIHAAPIVQFVMNGVGAESVEYTYNV
jgi:capsular exopolysaccharide synthesis family protein